MATSNDNLDQALQQAANAMRALTARDPKRRQRALQDALANIERAREAALAEEQRMGEKQPGQAECPGKPSAQGVIDLSVDVAPELPCTWPLFVPPLILMPAHYRELEPGASEMLVIDEHTGTHWDAPNHFVPPQSSGLPNAGAPGDVPSHNVPVWQFVGEACVIDVQDLKSGGNPGVSRLITPEMVQAWEQANRCLGPGDVVLFRSGYSDDYYKPFPEGWRFSAAALDLFKPTAQGWPAPNPECVEYLAKRKVNALGTDCPNIGPVGELAAPVHVAGQKHGLIWTEVLTNLADLPSTGAFYAVLGAKHANGSGAEARALAIVNTPVVAQLLKAARQQQVVDLTVLLHEDLPVTWPGRHPGEQHIPYAAKTLHTWDQYGPPAFVRTHIMDSQTGTHLIPPAYVTCRARGDRSAYGPEAQMALKQFEQRYGTLGETGMTADEIPLDQLIGPARVIDVRKLVGTTAPGPGAPTPRSPVIRVQHVTDYEQQCGRIEAGDIVLFHSGHSDRFCQPEPQGGYCMLLPLAGIAEGWPAPEGETIAFLAKERGVRCIGTDGPSMGSADRTQALLTYWAGAGEQVCFVEYLTNLGQLPPSGAYFLFGPVKIRGSHGGHGRALALGDSFAGPGNKLTTAE